MAGTSRDASSEHRPNRSETPVTQFAYGASRSDLALDRPASPVLKVARSGKHRGPVPPDRTEYPKHTKHAKRAPRRGSIEGGVHVHRPSESAGRRDDAGSDLGIKARPEGPGHWTRLGVSLRGRLWLERQRHEWRLRRLVHRERRKSRQRQRRKHELGQRRKRQHRKRRQCLSGERRGHREWGKHEQRRQPRLWRDHEQRRHPWDGREQHRQRRAHGRWRWHRHGQRWRRYRKWREQRCRRLSHRSCLL